MGHSFREHFKVLRSIKHGLHCALLFFWNFQRHNIIAMLRGSICFSGQKPVVQQLTQVKGPGRIWIGDRCHLGLELGGFHRGPGIELQTRSASATITIGDNVATNNNIFICCMNQVSIGNDSLIGQNVCIFDFEAHGIHPDHRREIGTIGSVKIGCNTWIGNNVTILKNTVIGDRSVVASGAVVSGIFPQGVVIGGIPARVIKSVEDHQQ